MVSRQKRRPNCACTKPTRRRSVQRGFTSAPATGGLAAWRCAARTCSPSAAAISGQRGGGHRCADSSTPRGRGHCRRAASPSRSALAVPCVRQPPWHNCRRQFRAAPGSVRGCGDGRHSGPDGVDPQPSGPSADDQLVTLIRKSLVPMEIIISEQQNSQPGGKPTVPKWTRFNAKTGEKLWSHNDGIGHDGGIITYVANGKQYLAVTTGWGTYVSQKLAKLYGEPFKSMPMDGGTLNVYALP